MTYRIDDIDVPKIDPFQNDQLDRKAVVNFLSDLIGRLDGPFVMALDATFGMGKSTLVRILIECLKSEGHRCINFNAWKVDYATDPLVALVASIDRVELGLSDEKQADIYLEQFEKVKNITNAIAKTSAVNAIKMLTSGVVDFEAILRASNSSESETNWTKNVVAAFNKESELFDSFHDELTEAVKLLQDDNADRQSNDTTRSSLVIFIDELDRCRPTFAVQLLERIKHFFDIPNIVFVLSLDKNQIEASIKAVYGAEIDAAEYLRRFFNLEFRIPVSDTQHYISNLLTRFDLDQIFDDRMSRQTQYDRKNFVEFLNILANATGLSLRAIEGCITRLRIVMDQTQNNQFLDPVLLALLIVLHSNRRNYYDRIIAGQVPPEDVIEYLTSLPGGKLSEREKNILYAYLLIADPNKARADSRIRDLKNKQFDDDEAASLVRIIGSIPGIERSQISLVQIAKKIDSVSWVG